MLHLIHQHRLIPDKPFADTLAVTAQDITLSTSALLLQVSVEGVPTLKPGHGHHEVPSSVTNDTLHVTFVIPLAGAAVTILKKIMGLKAAERTRSLPCTIRQYPRHQALVVVVQNRQRNAA